MPGRGAAIFLPIAHPLIATRRYARDFVRRWWNWQEWLAAERPHPPETFEAVGRELQTLYPDFPVERPAAESGLDATTLREVAEVVAGAGTALSTHTWRSATAGNEGGWQVARTLFLLNALLGAVGTKGGTYLNAWTKFVPKPIKLPRHPTHWNDLNWPVEYPLSMYELSFLLPHLVKEARGRLDVYFTRVYNPLWTNPHAFSTIRVRQDD